MSMKFRFFWQNSMCVTYNIQQACARTHVVAECWHKHVFLVDWQSCMAAVLMLLTTWVCVRMCVVSVREGEQASWICMNADEMSDVIQNQLHGKESAFITPFIPIATLKKNETTPKTTAHQSVSKFYLYLIHIHVCVAIKSYAQTHMHTEHRFRVSDRPNKEGKTRFDIIRYYHLRRSKECESSQVSQTIPMFWNDWVSKPMTHDSANQKALGQRQV